MRMNTLIYAQVQFTNVMICKLTWKNNNKSTAVISVREIKAEEIPWEDGEILLARFDKEKGLLIMKPEQEFEL